MNKYLNKRYEEDLTEFEKMSLHQPKVHDTTYVSKKVRNWNKKTKSIKTTSEEARFFGEENSKPTRKRQKRPQQEHDVQRDLARPVQRKNLKYKNAGEVGLDKAKQKRDRPGCDWASDMAQPTKKIRMIVAENELPVASSSKNNNDSSKKPPQKPKVANKLNDKVTKPPTQLQKPRPRSKSRKEPSKLDRRSKSDRPKVPQKSSNDKNERKSQNSTFDVKKSKSTADQVPTDPRKKRMSKVEEFRRLLEEQKLNTEREHVREHAAEPTSERLAEPTPEIPAPQKSVLDELGFSSSQESNSSEVEVEQNKNELEPQACELCKLSKTGFCSSCSSSEAEAEPESQVIRMEVVDEEPVSNEIPVIEILDDDEEEIPPCPTLSFEDEAYESDDDDCIFVSSTGPQKPISDQPHYRDQSTGQDFYYGQDINEF